MCDCVIVFEVAYSNISSFYLIIIVGWQVNKMGGEIKVTKKEGQGTLMRLCLLLSVPMDVTEQHSALNLTDNGLVVSILLFFANNTLK
jgi:hypothetical protein